MKIYKTFSPENSIGIIYNCLTGNPLRDSDIEVIHLENLKEYIIFLEKIILDSPNLAEPEDIITVQNLREDFIKSTIPSKPKPLEPVTIIKGAFAQAGVKPSGEIKRK